MGLLDNFRRRRASGRQAASERKAAEAPVAESPEDAIARLTHSMQALQRLSDLREEITRDDPEPGGDPIADVEVTLAEPVAEPAVQHEVVRRPTRVEEPAAPRQPAAPARVSGWAPIAARGQRMGEPLRTPAVAQTTRVAAAAPAQRDIRAMVSQVFSPSAPVSQRDLFAGRTNQMEDLVDTVYERGQHAVIYGERGVGKTSLAAVMTTVLTHSGATVVRVNCDGADDFSSVWRKILTEVRLSRLIPAGSKGGPTKALMADTEAKGLISPNDVRQVLQAISAHGDLVVFIDEFDTLRDSSVHGLFADTIKTLSDQLVTMTLVIIGVADNLDELIAEHGSVRRALAQIHMPRMSQAELGEILGRGLRRLGLAAEGAALTRMTQVSQGFPYYTKLLAQTAAREAIAEGRSGISLSDVDSSMKRVVGRVHETIRGLYNQATHGPNEAELRHALRASALARWDDRGFFGEDEVGEVWRMTSRDGSDAGDISFLLDDLSTTERGEAIEFKRTQRGLRYRFTTPLLQPYVLMEGLLSGEITPALLEEVRQTA
ncbi:MAG: hypothetical protein QOG04_2232 [Actinomycetota bacterium]|jgi:Cdc6-like AAA superfamily ATPase|nr:hypothetical protein [Actinomycetota bacterium]